MESYAHAIKGRDPFYKLKQSLNEYAFKLTENLNRKLQQSSTLEILKTIALANSVDVWMPGKNISSLRMNGNAYVDEALAFEVNESPDILYILDNSGEAVIDTLAALILADHGIQVTLVERTEPYELDVTIDEEREILSTVSKLLGYSTRRIRLLETGSRYPAPIAEYNTVEVRDGIEEASMIISKGIGNFEAFREKCPSNPSKIAIALRAKCNPVSRYFQVPRDTAVVSRMRCR
ncbi:MAG: ARMT1-like domain-containing protein [Desulfurococcales archaeon]|nr:ARMT1-like domain-containing protein [Desulfurococcales archaeon]